VRSVVGVFDVERAATGSITPKSRSADAVGGADEDDDFDWPAARPNHLERKPMALTLR
jgi:hypothetical protein